MSTPAEEARPRATPAEESLAAVALIRAYTARDLYTADRILARWATKGNGMNFAAMVASSAAVILTREAAGDRDGALRAADAALEAFKGVASRKLAALAVRADLRTLAPLLWAYLSGQGSMINGNALS